MTTAAACLLTLVLWTTQSTGSNLPIGSAQDFHIAIPQNHNLAPHRPSNALTLSPCGAAIEESVLHSPAFGTLHVKLGPGASLRAEAGVMVCMQNIVSETMLAGPADLQGHVSCLPSLGRALLGDQSLYINVFRPDGDGGARGWIALASNAPGDVVVHTIAADRQLFIQRGSFIASWPNVETDAKFKGWKGMLAGEGLFLLRAYTTDGHPLSVNHAFRGQGSSTMLGAQPSMYAMLRAQQSGHQRARRASTALLFRPTHRRPGLAGKIYFAAYGAVERYELKDAEELVVDSGHVVAFEDTLSYSIARLAGGLTSFFMGGEGFVCRFSVRDRGPRTVGGSVWVQTRVPVVPGNNKRRD